MLLYSKLVFRKFQPLPIKQTYLSYTSLASAQNDIRNIGIIAHIDAGKTTTTERMLYFSGFTKSIGNVDDGTTVMDFLPQERKRGITIQSAAITFGWRKARQDTLREQNSLFQINLIDTPGHFDFTFEVERSLSVLDGVIAIIDGVVGVQAQTRAVWLQANQYRLPRIVYINKLDRVGAKEKWESTLYQLRNQLTSEGPLLLTHVPLFESNLQSNSGSGFTGILDLIEMRLIKLSQAKMKSVPIDAEPALLNVLKNHRQIMVEQLCSIDDHVLEKYLESEDPMALPSSLLRQALTNATISRKAIPVLMGASSRNMGIHSLLDAVVDYLPSPTHFNDDKALSTNVPCAFVFKVVYDPLRSGFLCYVRVYTGTLFVRQVISNHSRKKKERIMRITLAYGNETEDVNSLGPGSIGVLFGLKETSTGDYLGESILKGFVVPKLTIQPPMMTRAIEPVSLKDEAHLKAAFRNILKEDPSLRVIEDKDTSQLLISGLGELHLEITADRLKQLGANAMFGPLSIAYREVLLEDSEETLEEVGNEIKLKAWKLYEEDIPPKTWNEFRGDPTHILDHTVNYGPLGYPVVMLGVEVVQSGSDIGLHSCLIKLLKGRTRLVEPLVRTTVQLVGAENKMSDVLADLAKRKARILEAQPQAIIAVVPLANLIGYATALRGLTAGYGTYEMQHEGYAPVLKANETEEGNLKLEPKNV